MEINNDHIIDSAGRIIYESGIYSLSVDNLARKLNVEKESLSSVFKNDDDILLSLFLRLESDVDQLIIQSKFQHDAPDAELKYLFKELNKLFSEKPFYLTIIFSDELLKRNLSALNVLFRIKRSAKDYLQEIIKKGKKRNIFKSKLKNRSLVNIILGGFRLQMNEQRLMNKMTRESMRIDDEKEDKI
ncbi:TetR/AcrR family transcriptional regulator [Prolixibacter denitrificans]|nr:TetR/AcrR family transcriptional regulator [Prolixibacter denitrificans]PSK82775.1 AcrR family transcriptional regulator [Prolixibacter denitrificans]